MKDLTSNAALEHCPSCDVELAPNAVLCVACGYHLAQGTHIATATVPLAEETPDSSNPYHPPATSTTDNSSIGVLLSIFWIHGRIPRWQWWAFQIGYFALIVLLGALMENGLIPDGAVVITFWIALWIVFMAQIKRWHDIDKSGLWCLVNLIPILGSLYALIELGFQRGTEGPNEYGDDPAQ